MALYAAAARRQLSLIELVVAAAVVAVLVGVFLHRVRAIEAAAERAIVITAVQDMQSRSLMHRAAVMRGEAAAAEIALGNPRQTVAPGLVRYVGEFERIDWDQVSPGSWVYDVGRKLLIYRIINEDFFETELIEPKRLRFRVEPSFVDRNANGRLDPETEPALGVRIVSLDARALAP